VRIIVTKCPVQQGVRARIRLLIQEVEPVQHGDQIGTYMRGVDGAIDGEVEGVVVLGVEMELTEAWQRAILLT
jgi:hypothetical protein